MQIEFHPGARDYRDPKTLINDLEKEYSKPRERFDACRVILEYIEREFKASLAAFFEQAASVLGKRQDEAIAIGLESCKQNWVQEQNVNIERMKQPIWYKAKNRNRIDPESINCPSPCQCKKTDKCPSHCPNEVEGPRSLPPDWIEHDKSTIPQRLKDQHWDEFQIANALYEKIRADETKNKFWSLLFTTFADIEAKYFYRNRFGKECKQIIAAGEAIPATEDIMPEVTPSQKKRKARKVDLIVCSTSYKDLLQIFKRLSEAELVPPSNFDNFPENTLPHFLLDNVPHNFDTKSSPEKIKWLGSHYTLIAFFNWLNEVGILNAVEYRKRCSMISKHFTKNGREIERNTVAAAARGNIHEKCILDADASIGRILRNCTRN